MPGGHVSFTLPVACKKRNDPLVSLWVIPCENGQSRHVSIGGELLIKRGCSRYKWLVQYCRCSVVLSIKVIDLQDNSELGMAEEEFDIDYSEHNNDHRVRMKLNNVLDHHLVFYWRNIATFTFQATVKLFEHHVRQEERPAYECKQCEEFADFTDIVPLPSTSSSASSGE